MLHHAAAEGGLAPVLEPGVLEERVFAHHLRSQWLALQRDPALLHAVGRLLHGQPEVDPVVWDRLRMTGLVRRSGATRTLRNQLYRRFFSGRLGGSAQRRGA